MATATKAKTLKIHPLEDRVVRLTRARGRA